MMRTGHDPHCDEVLDWIEPYLDGDLSEGEAAQVETHLAGCPACAAQLDLAARIQGELRSLPQLDCPPEILERVERQGRGVVVPFPVRRTASRLASRLTAAAAVLALAVGGGALFLNLQRPADPSPEQIAQATAEAKLALAYLGKATRRASVDLRDEVIAKRLIAPATRRSSKEL